MKKTTIGLMLYTTLFTAVSCGSGQRTNFENTKMEKPEDKFENTIFPKGEKAPAENFTETVYVQPLAPKTANK